MGLRVWGLRALYYYDIGALPWFTQSELLLLILKTLHDLNIL